MSRAPASRSVADERTFRYVGGDPSLDLSNTVVWTAEAPVRERLLDYHSLTVWAEGAGVIPASTARRLRARARRFPREAEAAYQHARWVRWTVRRVFTSVASGEGPGDALPELERLVTRAQRKRRLLPAAAAADWCWVGIDRDLAGLLWPVVLGAADLLTSDEADRIVLCAGPECGWLFVDRSRNGLRRWCQMETCGTQAKSRRRAVHGRSRGSR